jgi:hypothetical protein
MLSFRQVFFTTTGLSEYPEHLAWPTRGEMELPDIQFSTGASFDPIANSRIGAIF